MTFLLRNIEEEKAILTIVKIKLHMMCDIREKSLYGTLVKTKAENMIKCINKLKKMTETGCKHQETTRRKRHVK